jgi:hypothetical protein
VLILLSDGFSLPEHVARLILWGSGLVRQAIEVVRLDQLTEIAVKSCDCLAMICHHLCECHCFLSSMPISPPCVVHRWFSALQQSVVVIFMFLDQVARPFDILHILSQAHIACLEHTYLRTSVHEFALEKSHAANQLVLIYCLLGGGMSDRRLLMALGNGGFMLLRVLATNYKRLYVFLGM